MRCDTGTAAFIEAGNKAQLEWESSAECMMDAGLDPETVGLAMLAAAQHVLRNMYPPELMALVLRSYADHWEKLEVSQLSRLGRADEKDPGGLTGNA